MHKKSLEMSKKCSSPSESDSTRCDSFCEASERRGSGETREVEREEEELLETEDEEDMEEEVAIDLSSSSKQQQQEEAGSSVRSASSPRQQSGGESDEHSWRPVEECDVDWRDGGMKIIGSFFRDHCQWKDTASFVTMQTAH